MIWTHLVGPTPKKLHTKSQGHQPSGLGEKIFLKGFTIYGHGCHLGHVTKTIWTNFHSPSLRSLHMKGEFNWPSGFRGVDVWKCWQMDATVIGILLAHPWAFGSGWAKNKIYIIISSVKRNVFSPKLFVSHTLIFKYILDIIGNDGC